METTGKALVHHWDWAAQKGLMNPNTARVLRNACYQVLVAVFEGEWEVADVKTLDPDAVFLRFQNLRGKDLTPRSLQDYRRRLLQALDSYRAYVADPASWKGPGQERPLRADRVRPAERRARVVVPDSALTDAESVQPEDGNMMVYPFPIRNMTARLLLPRDLRMSEARRLVSFITSLAIDFGSSPALTLPEPKFE
jgi:hypothetical protein